MRTDSRLIGLIVFFLCFVTSVIQAQQIPATTVDAVLNVDQLRAGDHAAIAVRLQVPAGYHIQSNKPLEPNLIPLQVTASATDGVHVGAPIYPRPSIQTYPLLGKLSVFSDQVVVYLPLTVDAGATPGPANLSIKIRFQMCDDKACYAPKTVPVSITTTLADASATVTPLNEALFSAMPRIGDDTLVAPAPDANPPPVLNPAAADVSSIWMAFGFAFVAGIIFNAMPCVLPVLPLKAMSFYEVSQHHRGRTIALAIAFSLGIISVFAVLALLIFVFKRLSWGEQFSNPWFAWGLVVLLGVMGLGMFGTFTMALPQGVYRFSPRHDTYSGNFLFGILAAILSTPCTAPLFPLVIAWAVLQPQLIAVLSMVIVGVGMAFPYLLLSAFPGMARRFPRVGPWAELVKQMMGFLLIGSAVFFAAGRLMSFDAMWWPLVPVAAVAAVYLVARTVQLTTSAMPVGISSMIAVAMLGGTLWLAIFMSGWPGAGTGTSQIDWEPYSAQKLADAAASNRPVLVDFTANWCLNCKTVEATVFRKTAVIDTLRQRGVLTLRADLTDDDAAGWALLKTLSRSGGIPLTAVYLPGHERPVQLESIYAPSALLQVLGSLPALSVTTP